MPGVRAVLVVAIAATLLLGACGEDGDSNPSSTSTAQQSTDTSANEGSARARHGEGGERASDRRGRKPKQGTTPSAQFEGNVFFYKGRSRCLTIPVEVLARIYQAKSDDPEDVAKAYAEREAAPIFREAAIAGCLAGIESRR
jgi:hypothetical protein